MGYAVRNDGLGWRAINSEDDCLENESYSEQPPAPKQPTLAELVTMKIAQINAEFEQSMQQITTGYPPNEISSWSKQEAEARAYAADAEAATPLLDALAQGRAIPKAELVDRIIAKADLFAGVSGYLIGKRQGLEDALNALPEDATAEDVEAINWS